MLRRKVLFSLILSIFLIETVSAHCPLCTVGAGAAAAGAVWLGISKIVIALFLGAFAMSMGMWFARILDKKGKYIPFQNSLIITSIFLLTILPLIPLVKVIIPLNLSFVGGYENAYLFNYSLASSLLGGLIVFVSPKINKKIKEKRNGKGIPYQGILITFSLLLIAAIAIQLIV